VDGRRENQMTLEEIKDVILEIIQEIDEDANVADLKPDLALRDQLDLDSMDFLDIVMELRKRYKIQIPETDYPQLASLDSCVNYLLPRLQDV
jgi:acyl carrier protein